IKKIFGKLTVLLSTLLLVFTACSGGTSKGTKELTIAVDRPSNSLSNVVTSESANADIIGNFMEGLLIRDLEGNLVNGAAESYEVSADGLTYTFKLRDNNWSNGKPVIAADFVFAWREQATNKKAKYPQYQSY